MFAARNASTGTCSHDQTKNGRPNSTRSPMTTPAMAYVSAWLNSPLATVNGRSAAGSITSGSSATFAQTSATPNQRRRDRSHAICGADAVAVRSRRAVRRVISPERIDRDEKGPGPLRAPVRDRYALVRCLLIVDEAVRRAENVRR